MRYWLYYFIKSNFEIPVRTFFRGINLEGKENVPKNKPVFIAANHAGSFMDGVVIEYTNYQKVFTLVRGDAFNKPIFNKILRSMLLLPIFRARDASAEKARKGNASTREECYELFKQNKNILIFSEGIAYPEKHLRPLKKGTAGIAAEMLKRSDGQMGLQIVPCAINYSHFGKLRGQLQIIYAEPLNVKDHYEEILEDENRFARNFTKLLEEKLSEIVVETKGEYEAEKELAHEMLLNEFNDKFKFRQYNSGSAVIAKKINALEEQGIAALKEYNSSLISAGIQDRTISELPINFIAILAAVFTFTFSLPAALLYRFFWFIAKKGADKMVKNIVLYDSVYLGLGLVFSMLFYVILLCFVFLALPASWTILWKVFILLASSIGTVAWFIAYDEFKAIVNYIKFLGLPSKTRESLKDYRKKAFSFLR